LFVALAFASEEGCLTLFKIAIPCSFFYVKLENALMSFNIVFFFISASDRSALSLNSKHKDIFLSGLALAVASSLYSLSKLIATKSPVFFTSHQKEQQKNKMGNFLLRCCSGSTRS
jgi:hypothetical protein